MFVLVVGSHTSATDMPVKHVNEPLVQARVVKSLADHNWYDASRQLLKEETNKALEEEYGEMSTEPHTTNQDRNETSHDNSNAQKDDHPVHLLAEYIQILPVPLPLLFVMQYQPYFMSALEREIDLCLFEHRLLECVIKPGNSHENEKRQNPLDEAHRNVTVPTDNKNHKEPHHHVPLVELLRQATTLVPIPLYDRLEFLGDAVLGYCLAINLFATNPLWLEDLSPKDETRYSPSNLLAFLDRTWDNFSMAEHISRAGKNKALAEAAKRIQLQNVLFVQAPFQSAYRGQDSQQPSSNKNKTPPISQKTLSDCVESLLCAAFLSHVQEPLLVFILNLLQLPLPATSEKSSSSASTCWFQASGTALQHGYSFSDCHLNRLSEVADILNTREAVQEKLHQNVHHLMEILGIDVLSRGNNVGQYDKGFCTYTCKDTDDSILMQCALFDDDLLTEDSSVGHEMLPLALIRESLYTVGAYALQLMISHHFVESCRHANSNDLHVLRACVSSRKRNNGSRFSPNLV